MYDIALLEKPSMQGIKKEEMMRLFDKLNHPEAFPLEIEAYLQNSIAMGFITIAAAEALDYDYSELDNYIAEILDNMELENESCEYDFPGLKIWLGRNI